jgi:hypothetical protein
MKGDIMNTWKVRAATVVAAAATFVTVGAGGAWAHDCYNASRSDTGDTAAGSHSQAWFTLTISDAVAEDVANGLYTEEQGDCVYQAWLAGGGPVSVTFHVKGANGTDGILAENNPNEGLLTDGHGIDHFSEAYGALIASAFTACGVSA